VAEKVVAPYGSWRSPITSDLIVSETITLGQIELDGQDVYWNEGRPAEGGRSVIVRHTPDGRTLDVTPPGFNARSRVHEYGGGAFFVHAGNVYFSNFTDNRVYHQAGEGEPQPITPETSLRYADFELDQRRRRLICIREDHSRADREAINTIAAIPLSGTRGQGHPGGVLVSGNDFYSSPRLSSDGSRLAWLTWNRPNMPWDGTELWVGTIDGDLITESRRIAGGTQESIFQPEWSPDGALYFVSDRTGWWNFHRWRDSQVEALTQGEAEFGLPQWVFGMTTYGLAADGRLIGVDHLGGTDRLVSLDVATKTQTTIETPYTEIDSPAVGSDRVVFVGGSPSRAREVVQLDLASGETRVLRRSTNVSIDTGYLSIPETIEFPTEIGLMAYAFYYPPRNRDFNGPPSERPPLIVRSHGGPTGAASTTLSLAIQYWTSRGFAFLDVNYGGSTGYGRAYRERLNGKWGVVDVDDAVNAARYLVERGLVDPERLSIAGGSAGGYTALAALTLRDTFKAGASHYGISDLEPWDFDTHKFESRYSDRLVGPYPEAREVYRARSPINFIERISGPVILFQGLEDKVVPPNQAQMMVDRLRAQGLPFAYVAFAGEGHGFRRAENIKRMLDAELYFYSRVFGFDLPDSVEPVDIENAEGLETTAV
jgi:dipeptidyl aminopeptidase/acylaminoacyl peptidase